MDPTTLRLIQGAAGAAGEATYVDDVFSTFLYEGTSATNSIDNGIDLSGEGGAVWIKARDATQNNYIFDTERGADKGLITNLADAQSSGWSPNWFTSFDSDGFTLGPNGLQLNSSSIGSYASWSFRKAPGFFDVVTWTGDGTASRAISHSLGSTPGFITVKRIDSASDWYCWHRSISTGNLSSNNLLILNSSNLQTNIGTVLGTASSTTFEVGGDSSVNASGGTYVAYVFAHDDQSFGTNSDEAIINCGSFTVDSFNRIQPVNLNFEPQFLILKMSSANSAWFVYDTMRGLPALNGNSLVNLQLSSNLAEVTESTANNTVSITPNGFTQGAGYGPLNASSTGVYIAIRRPHKPPTAATEVFDTNLVTTGTPTTTFTSGFVTDAIIYPFRILLAGPRVSSRLTGNPYLDTSSSDADNGTTTNWDSMTGLEITSSSGLSLVDYMFRRAPGFFDVVTYTGDGSAGSTKYHNLGVTPELVIIKDRSATYDWFVGSTYLDDYDRHVFLNLTDAQSSAVQWISFVNSTSFRVYRTADLNTSSNNYLCYLFATLAGISKVGTYSGTGSNVDVDCGFSAGARFILIKRTDSTGDWYTYDSARGIASGNDPYLLLNSTAAEVTGTDYIDPLNSGFTVTSTAPAGMNASGGTYLFLAIA